MFDPCLEQDHHLHKALRGADKLCWDLDHLLHRALYSADMLLPVELEEKHEKIVVGQFKLYLNLYFNYFQRAVGYILISFLAAGLSGITKKLSAG